MSKSLKKTNILSDLKHYTHDRLSLMNNWWYRGAKQTIRSNILQLIFYELTCTQKISMKSAKKNFLPKY